MMIQQLVLSPNGDDDMGTLLGLMHSAPPTELQLKTDILRVSLISVLVWFLLLQSVAVFKWLKTIMNYSCNFSSSLKLCQNNNWRKANVSNLASKGPGDDSCLFSLWLSLLRPSPCSCHRRDRKYSSLLESCISFIKLLLYSVNFSSIMRNLCVFLYAVVCFILFWV